MTAHEKAISAINRRLENLQASLREPGQESARPFLFQSVVGTLGVAEALNDYIEAVGEYARRRHAELKQTNEALAERHAEMLKSGNVLLEQFKANPGDRALHKEIERLQQDMAGIQKTLRRGANALQRDVAPGVAQIDQLAEAVKRLSEAEQLDALKRVFKTLVAYVGDLYADHPGLPARRIVDAAAWEESVSGELEEAAGFHDAYARTTYQTILALELMALAVSEKPPQTTAEATTSATQRVVGRIKEVTARFTDDRDNPSGASR